MRVFLSWSGQRSRQVAAALREWLPDVLHYAEPWMSDADIHAGQRWGVEVGANLEACNIGILCVTPENVSAPWLLFEAGALSKFVGEAAVIPLLMDVSFSDINTGPLGQFQAKKLDAQGTWELVESINALAANPVPEGRLRRLFDRAWPELAGVTTLPAPERSRPEQPRSVELILEELVVSIRGVEVRLASLENDMHEITDRGDFPIVQDVHVRREIFGPEDLHTDLGTDKHVPVQAIRDAARYAVARTSLRAVAQQIPMSPMGLQQFINGASPYQATVRKLASWYNGPAPGKGAGTSVSKVTGPGRDPASVSEPNQDTTNIPDLDEPDQND